MGKESDNSPLAQRHPMRRRLDAAVRQAIEQKMRDEGRAVTGATLFKQAFTQ